MTTFLLLDLHRFHTRSTTASSTSISSWLTDAGAGAGARAETGWCGSFPFSPFAAPFLAGPAVTVAVALVAPVAPVAVAGLAALGSDAGVLYAVAWGAAVGRELFTPSPLEADPGTTLDAAPSRDLLRPNCDMPLRLSAVVVAVATGRGGKGEAGGAVSGRNWRSLGSPLLDTPSGPRVGPCCPAPAPGLSPAGVAATRSFPLYSCFAEPDAAEALGWVEEAVSAGGGGALGGPPHCKMASIVRSKSMRCAPSISISCSPFQSGNISRRVPKAR